MESNGDPYHSQRNEPLAVVGMACRLPGGVKDVPSFWDLLCQGRSGITEVPQDRWNRERFYHPDTAVPLRMHSQWGGFIDELDGFDARFWGISPREAARMDPQQRWLLEVAWEAVEDAGIPPSRLAGTNTGVFVGIASSDYAQIQMTNHEGLDVHSNSGNTLSIAANRISYALDLKGPSISVDTACSSSLVAVSLACRSIWDRTCDAALVGGVNAVIVPSTTMAFSKATMLSTDGKCFAFDSRANGYVRGEGAGVLCIKPLSRALADGDPVYAVIRAAVTNQDGKTSSMTVPGVEAQKAMLELAYHEAGIPPHRVLYVEAHGTGTPLGDPIEATALGTVLSRGRSKGTSCLVGSVKTNIGHLEAGSGIAGLIKAILVLDRGQVPPSLNFCTPNPKIPLAKLRLEVPVSLRPLPAANGHMPVTAVNSFGFGGTNAHVVLEGVPQVEDLRSARPLPDPAQRPFVLPISARDDVALRNNVRAFLRALRDDPPLPDLCYSAGDRREHHVQRLAVVGSTADEIRDRLSGWLGNPEGAPGVVYGEHSSATGPLAFVFTGQGPQWWGMGQQLLQREPLVQDTLARIDRHLSKYADWSLLQEMTRGESDSRVDQTDIAQPVIFALQVALAELLKSWGITPHLVVGHSVGEMAAAYVAGIYDLEDAVRIAFHRSRLQHTTKGRGRMLATALGAAQARAMLGHDSPQVHISAINSPSLVTLSGDTEQLERIAARLEASHTFLKWLGIDYAFHSDQMDSIQVELLQCLADIHPRPGSIPFVSTVTGSVLPGEELHAEYWWRNVRLPVLFAPAVNTLIQRGCGALLEVGPNPSLRSSLEDCLAVQNHPARIFHTLRRSSDESEEMLKNVAGLHVWGADVAWAALNQSKGHLVRTPRYQWTHEKFWLEAHAAHQNRLADTVHPLLGIRVPAVEPTWEFVLDPRLFPYVNDHKLWGSVVFPAAGFAEIGLALARQWYPEHPHAVEDLRLQQALFAFEDKLTMVRVVFSETDKTYRVYSATDQRQEWELHAQGRLTPLLTATPAPVDLDRLRQRLPHFMDHEQYYADLIAAGYGFGPNFRQVQNVWREPGEALAQIVVPPELESGPLAYCFHPAVLDACFQTFRAVRDLPVPETGSYLFLPGRIGRIRVFVDRPPCRLWSRATPTRGDGPGLVCDILVYDDQGHPVAEILGFRVDPVEQKTTGDDLGNCLYQFRWEPCRLRGIGHQGACHLAATDEIVAATEAGVPQLYAQYGLGDYSRDFLPRSERITCQFIQNAFLKLGWRVAPGDTFTLADFVRQLAIIRQHQRVARIQLKALQDAGVLQEVGPDRWTVLQEPRFSDPNPQLAQLEADYPRLAGSEIALSKMNGEAADKILTGEVNATELLFPGGSSRLVGQFYVDGLDFPAQNRLISLAVAKAIEKLPPRRTLRVLEIGAGTGSLTREVLPILPPDRTEYLFTDIGPAFVTAAKGLFAKYPFVDYKPFDLEKPAVEQGLARHGYDLVLASAVLHATEDLRRTLQNIVSCLTHEGLLIFLEPIHRRNVTDTIFGGLPGWWKFTDTDLRPDHALMPRGKWEHLLTECGFRDVRSVISAPTESESEQAILIAVAPADTGESARVAASPVAAGKRDAAATSVPAPVVPPATHLIFADRGGLADQIIEMLAARGDRTIRIDPSSWEASLARSSAAGATPQSADAMAEDAVMRSIQEAGPLTTVMHCWCLDQPPAEQLTGERLTQAQHAGVLTALRVLRTLSRQETDSPPRVYFVTRSAQAVVESDPCTGLAAAPVVGFARVANAEHASFRCSVIDLASEPSPHEVEDVFHELTQGDKELEIAFRQGRRFVNRLRRSDPADWPRRTVPAEDSRQQLTPFRLQIDKPGVLDHLSLNETYRPEPGPDEVEVRVMAGGINFRDVMKALGIYPGNPPDRTWFGDDFAGKVERVGERVKEFQPGDSVAGIAPYCFRSFALTDARTVFPLPHGMSWTGAATLPTVFLTAHYAMEVLARMQAGERILIHAAAGGVGQAAIQIARRLGLQVFATAGSPSKRQLLHDLGVRHVLDSRTLDFADQLLALTDGHGVDAVLNSLSGPFIPKSLSVLAPFGRFLEIGKVDIYNNSRLGLEALKHNISYFVIDLAECLLRKPTLVARMLSELAERFHAGEYQPLSYQEFPVTEVADAFRQMAQGQHMGKNVLSFDVKPIPIAPCTMDGHLFRPAASYLITGGAGGLGLEVAKWMARHGARHLVLMSRSGPRDAQDQLAMDDLRVEGVQILDARGDVTCPDDVRRVVEQICDSMPVLRGVIHGAMVLDDGFISDLQDEQFLRVLNPKMMGAWNLHVQTRDLPLEHFICFSSFSAVAGGAKQSNYNAGNLFLDSLAHYRHQLGLPALTMNWGGIAGAGFVHRNQKITEYFQKIGFQSFSVEEALRVMRLALQYDQPQIAVARVDWQSMERFSPFVAGANMFAPLTRENARDGSSASSRPMILAASGEERGELVRALLAEQLAAVCGIDAAKVNPDTSIIKLGLDSLMAIELINRVEGKLGLVVPMGKVLGGPTLRELSETVVQLLAYSADDPGAVERSSGTERGPSNWSEVSVAELANLPLTEAQQTHWFQYRLEPQGSNYVAMTVALHPPVDSEAMRWSLMRLARRYPQLAATFSDESGEPLQSLAHTTPDGLLSPSCLPDFATHDVTDLPARERTRWMSDRAQRPFDLEHGPTARVELFHCDHQGTVLLFVAHRIVADNGSMAVWARELVEGCLDMPCGESEVQPWVDDSFAKYVMWERSVLQSGAIQASHSYWKEQLADLPPLLNLRPGLGQSSEDGRNESHRWFRLDHQLSHRLLLLAAEHDVKPAIVLLTAWELLLHRRSEQDDLLVACGMNGRESSDLRTVMGSLARWVPIRSRQLESRTVADWLRANQSQWADAERHARGSLDPLLQAAAERRTAGRSILCQAGFAMVRDMLSDESGVSALLNGMPGHHVLVGRVRVEGLDATPPTTPWEICLTMEEANGSFLGCWQQSARAVASLENASLAPLHEAFIQVLQEVAADPFVELAPQGRATPRTTALPPPRFVAARNETEHLVSRVWQDLLGGVAVGMRDDFFALGGHSLKIAMLGARLRRMFSVDVPLPVLMASPTVEKIAGYIDDHRDAQSPPIVDLTQLDFADDAQLDPAIRPPTDAGQRRGVDRILLTGATGFLGAFLLDELLRQTDAEIYCLIRGGSRERGLRRLFQNLEKYELDPIPFADRIVPVPGDLSQPLLGLAAEDFDQLAREIDVIYHNGAVLNFAYTYSVLRESNVQGTHEILRLAMRHHLKPTHYVSTVAVLASSHRSAFDLVTEEERLPPFSSLRDAYSQTKWMSEQLIAVARDRGLPVTIYRPGGITGHSQTGISNVGDLIHVMALGCYQLGTLPHLDLEFNLVPVDFVAAALVALSRRPDLHGKTFHLVNPEPLPLDAFVEWVQRSDLPLERMPYEHWRSQVSELVATVPSDVFGLLTKFFMPGVISGDMQDAIPQVLRLRYDCRQTLAALADGELSCPRMNEELLSRYLSQLRQFGLLQEDGTAASVISSSAPRKAVAP